MRPDRELRAFEKVRLGKNNLGEYLGAYPVAYISAHVSANRCASPPARVGESSSRCATARSPTGRQAAAGGPWRPESTRYLSARARRISDKSPSSRSPGRARGRRCARIHLIAPPPSSHGSRLPDLAGAPRLRAALGRRALSARPRRSAPAAYASFPRELNGWRRRGGLVLRRPVLGGAPIGHGRLRRRGPAARARRDAPRDATAGARRFKPGPLECLHTRRAGSYAASESLPTPGWPFQTPRSASSSRSTATSGRRCSRARRSAACSASSTPPRQHAHTMLLGAPERYGVQYRARCCSLTV